MATTIIKITQIKSIIGRTERQKATIKALGLGKINRSAHHKLTPAIQGMVGKVAHLITIQQT